MQAIQEQPTTARTAAELTARDHLKWLREMRSEMRTVNAAREKPDPVCRRCGVVFQSEESDFLFRGRCCTCGIWRLEKLIKRIIARRGRRGAIKKLRRLAR